MKRSKREPREKVIFSPSFIFLFFVLLVIVVAQAPPRRGGFSLPSINLSLSFSNVKCHFFFKVIEGVSRIAFFLKRGTFCFFVG